MSSALKLYYSPAACSLAVHIALREVGATFDTVAVDLITHKLANGDDYYAISPHGYVPLLEFADGSRHTEAAALLQYVADLDPQQALIGAPGSTRRQAVVEQLTFVSSELHKVFSPWLWHKETADSTKRTVKERLAQRFAELEAHFVQHEWLAGDYSVADAYAFTILNWTNFVGPSLAAFPHVQAYMKRVAGRPAARAALAAEGLLK